MVRRSVRQPDNRADHHTPPIGGRTIQAGAAAHNSEERIRLRAVLHAGEVIHDEHDATGVAVNLAFRFDPALAVPGAARLCHALWSALPIT
jgi:class 3 adenylate cyclase